MVLRLRYAARRILIALSAGAAAAALLVGLFCPVIARKRSILPHGGEYDAVRFVRAWNADGPLDMGWLTGELFLSLAVALFVWFVYTDFDPPP